MNKSELIETIAAQAEVSKASAQRMLDATLQTIVDVVANGDEVTIPGFGAFKSVERAERTGRNPKTGEAITIAAACVPKFSAGATFKSTVAKK